MAAKKTAEKPAQEPETVGGVPVDAPELPDWQKSNSPSPAEQRAQEAALAKERAAQ